MLLTLATTHRPATELGHLLRVLVPVRDNDKHYWVGDEEVEKLPRYGEGWLAVHSEREAIARRYLKHQRGLIEDALGIRSGPCRSAQRTPSWEAPPRWHCFT